MSAKQARPVYLDASALVKLVLPEPESPALIEALADDRPLVTSIVGWVETHRAVHAATDEAALRREVDTLFEQVALVEVSQSVAYAALNLQPTTLRTLDAVHLATALMFGEELDAFVVYDRRLGETARETGLPVLTPGR